MFLPAFHAIMPAMRAALACVIASVGVPLVFGGEIPKHEHIIFLSAGDWDDVTDVQIQIESNRAHAYNPNPTGFHNTGYTGGKFAYLVSVEPDDFVTMLLQHKGTSISGRQKMSDCRSKAVAEAWKWDDNNSTDLPKMNSLCHNIKFFEAWKDFAENAPSGVSAMQDQWREVRKNHVGFEVNIFADGLTDHAGKEVVFHFTSSDKPKDTRKHIQKMGAVFSSWSIPQGGGDVRITAPGFPERTLTCNKAHFFTETLESGVHVYMMLSPTSSKSDHIWRNIQSHYQDAEGAHPFWDSKSRVWKSDALEKLYKDVQGDKTLLPDSIEFLGAVSQSKNMIIIVVILVLISLMGAVAYWFFCKRFEDDSELSLTANAEQEVPEVGNNLPKQPSGKTGSDNA